jgi:NAD(P)-dependent dehydrogenase (short-subunit alcohol dehydrogenase family)
LRSYKERKQFFSKEKNQKTFASVAYAAGKVCDSDAKVFCFFLSEKKILLWSPSMQEMRFHEDVAIITGGARGLGREYALALAKRGAAVVINDVDQAIAKALAEEIRAGGGRAAADGHSVADPPGAQGILETALENFGHVSILVNNAGVIDFALLPEISDAAWRRMLAVTLDGAFVMTRAVWPHMAARRYGRIINTTSNAGFAGNEQLVHYGAAKLGVAGFTRALAREAAGTGITVNAVAPMAITRMNRDAFFAGADAISEDWQADIREGRLPMGPPSMVAPAVLWLAHRGTMINGEIFSVSSGRVARVAFVVGEGYFNPNHSPEDLRANEGAIRTLGNYLDPACTADELAVIPTLFRQN